MPPAHALALSASTYLRPLSLILSRPATATSARRHPSDAHPAAGIASGLTNGWSIPYLPAHTKAHHRSARSSDRGSARSDGRSSPPRK